VADEVRALAAQQQFQAAESRVDREFKAHGTSPDLVLAESWLARAAGSRAAKFRHLLDEALSWHVRYLQNGTMQPV